MPGAIQSGESWHRWKGLAGAGGRKEKRGLARGFVDGDGIVDSHLRHQLGFRGIIRQLSGVAKLRKDQRKRHERQVTPLEVQCCDWNSRAAGASCLSCLGLSLVLVAVVRNIGSPAGFHSQQPVHVMRNLAGNGIAISMDGKGAWRDNVFVERLWRSVKYEEVYLRAYDSVSEARASIGRYLDFYNSRRPHSSLDGMTPDQAYFTSLPLRLAA